MRALAGALTHRCFATILLAVALSACDPSSGETVGSTPIVQTVPSASPSKLGARSAHAFEPPEGSGFDFYVLSLSWSPSYCEAEGEDANRQQCDSGRFYAFVVHGLWPQFERGYPTDCSVRQREVPEDLIRSLYDIMPSAGLIRHQWRKHGSCTGLSQAGYFAVLRSAREVVSIPGEFTHIDGYRSVAPFAVEERFLQSNPNLPANGIAVTCDDRYLREVRICLTKDLEFRGCEEVDRRACRMPKAVMPPVRGR